MVPKLARKGDSLVLTGEEEALGQGKTILIFLLTRRGPPHLVIHLCERCFYPLLLKNNYIQWSFSRVAYNLVVLNSSGLLESA